MPPARRVRLAGQPEQRLPLVVVGDAVQGEQVGHVAFLETDPSQLHPADLGVGAPDQVAGVVAGDALGLAKAAQLRTQQDAQHGRAAGRAAPWLLCGHPASQTSRVEISAQCVTPSRHGGVPIPPSARAAARASALASARSAKDNPSSGALTPASAFASALGR